MGKRDRTGGSGLNNRHQVQAVELKTVAAVVARVDQPAEIDAEETAANIPQYRRCPLCWDGRKGYGVAYSKQGNRRFYKCRKTLTDQAACGHTWTAIVQLTVVRIEHREVEVDER